MLAAASLCAQIAPPAPGDGASLEARQSAVASSPASASQPAVDSKSIVRAVMNEFAVNDQVSVPALGKPLPLTGSWGVQTVFPKGAPMACRMAQVPCAVVMYRVPEAHVLCEWAMGLTTVLEPQKDGPPVHKHTAIVLDENNDAARYTIRHKWINGEDRPQRDRAVPISYPEIARAAHQGGEVVVSFTVDPTGAVHSVHTDYGSAMLGAAVADSVRQWHFVPQQVGSQAVWFRSRVAIDFGSERVDITAGMDPSGKVMVDEADPHLQAGPHMDNATGGYWESCTAVNCSFADPPTAK